MAHTLKEMRLNLGISLEDVCHDLSIRLEYLQALEDNTKTPIPDIYMKGYEKLYHKYLNSKIKSDQNGK